MINELLSNIYVTISLIAIAIFIVILAVLQIIKYRDNKKVMQFVQKEPETIQKKENKRAEKKISIQQEIVSEKEEQFRELKPYIPIQFKLTDVNTWKDKYRELFAKDKCVLINMELLNGMNRLFLVKEKQGGFQYRKKKYILDDDSKYYIIEAKMYAFDFHEGFTLPIKRKIPVSTIRETIKKSEVSEVEYSTNPETLQNFMVAKIAEGIMKGAEIDAWMKQIRILLIIFGIISAIHFFLYAQKSGVFAQIGI